MPKLTKLSIAMASLMLATSSAATAQEVISDTAPDVMAVNSFTSADIDADGALDRDEFVSFVVMKSDEGDADYKSIKISAEYDNHFNMKDYNADGLLTAGELKEDPVAQEPDVTSERKVPIDEPG